MRIATGGVGAPPSVVDHERLSVLMLGEARVAESPGGMNRYFEALADCLRREGTRVAIVLLGEDEPQPLGAGAGARGRPLPLRLFSYWRAASRLAPGVDVVDSHFALYSLLPVLGSRLRRKPLVVHFHGPWARETVVAGKRSRVGARVRFQIERAVYRHAAEIVTLSDAFKEIVVNGYGVRSERVTVIPPGVDLTRFTPDSRCESRRLLGIEESAFAAVMVRRLDHDANRMGLDVALRAWRIVVRQVDGAVLLVVGDGDQRLRYETLADDLGIAEQVLFTGRVDDGRLADAYRAADVSVVPTRALEGFGLVTLESLACGTPPIVTACGGLPEAVAGLDPTLVVPVGDDEALAQRLIAAAHGDRPSRSACRTYAENFGWSDCAASNRRVFARAGRPRVVFLDHVARLSGGELALARLLAELDVDATVILGEDGPLVDRLREAGAEVEVMPFGSAGRNMHREQIRALPRPQAAIDTGRYVLRLAHRLRQLQPDIVHSNSLKASLYGGLAARIAGVPMVVHLRDRLSEDCFPSSALRIGQRTIHHLASALVVNSTATLETVAYPPQRTAVVPSGIPTSWCTQARPVRNANGVLRIGMIGRIAPWKGQDVFIRAFAEAFPGRAARAVIAGSPLFGEKNFQKELQDLIVDLELEETVELVGFIDDVWPLLGEIDVLVHASRTPEPFGQVVLEGMAAGLAVVATDEGGPAELITDDHDGLLVARDDPHELSRALVRLAQDPLLRQRLGRNAQVRASAMTVGESTTTLLELYSRVLDRKVF